MSTLSLCMESEDRGRLSLTKAYRCFQSHTAHYFANVFCLTANVDLSVGHHQAIVQEHECAQKLSAMR